MLVNYLPVGSEQATRFYASCALEAGLGFVNNIPVFIASDPVWAKRFADKNLPVIGDDIKAQMGATIVHRSLVDLFRKRGVKVERTYQLNTGGNTDFLNGQEPARSRRCIRGRSGGALGTGPREQAALAGDLDGVQAVVGVQLRPGGLQVAGHRPDREFPRMAIGDLVQARRPREIHS